jgi:hypothetical protein
MSNRSSEIVIVCEDPQHASFITKFLNKAHGIKTDGRLRIEKNPKGKGSGEQFVRNRYPIELSYIRQRHAKTTLIVVTDADNKETVERAQTLNTACSDAGIEPRNLTDNVAFIIPKRNIETWIDYLSGKEEKTKKAYNKLSKKESKCQPAVEKLHDLCQQKVTPPDFPESLVAACNEYRKVKSGFSA